MSLITGQKDKHWFLYLSLLFLLLILLFNWPHYIDDADDPLTIAYHFWGRNKLVQGPYSLYDSMCDYLLSFLPRNYHVLYTVMVLWTFASGVAIFLLLIELGKNFQININGDYYIGGFILLLAVPEFSYLLLSYKSSIIGFSFILFSHYLLLRQYKKTNSYSTSAILLSALFFSFGASCRWNLVTYLPAILADFVYLGYKGQRRHLTGKLILWVTSVALFFGLLLSVSGYSIKDFFEIIAWGKAMIKIHPNQFIYNVATATTLFTPIVILTFVFAAIRLIRHYRSHTRLLIFTLSSYIPYIYLSFIPNLKFLITLFPAITLLLFSGIAYLNNISIGKLKFIKYLALVVMLAPWFMGIWIYSSTTLWGPGFNIKSTADMHSVYGKTIDQRFSINRISFRPSAGFAISSTEGNRPLWGYFYTLFCGGLYNLDKKLALQAQQVIKLSSTQHIPIYTDYACKMNPYLLDALCRNNYQTNDSEMNNGNWTQRSFIKDRDTVVIRAFNDPGQAENFAAIKQLFSSSQFIASFTYSSLLEDFIFKAPQHGIIIINHLDAFSCICKIE